MIFIPVIGVVYKVTQFYADSVVQAVGQTNTTRHETRALNRIHVT